MLKYAKNVLKTQIKIENRQTIKLSNLLLTVFRHIIKMNFSVDLSFDHIIANTSAPNVI